MPRSLVRPVGTAETRACSVTAGPAVTGLPALQALTVLRARPPVMAARAGPAGAVAQADC
jgi:hypothetical protein